MPRFLRRASAQPVRRAKRKRFRFSLNGLAIQLSAFALSFTLVALLVVSGSKAAFVEESEVLADYVPIGAAASPSPSSTNGGRRPSRPAAPAVPTSDAPEVPPVEDPPVLLVDEPVVEEEVEEEPAEEPVDEIEVEIEVELSDSDAGTAMFGGDTLLPGVPLDRCIEVNYSGADNPGPVVLYAAAASGDLAPYLDLTIHMGSADAGAFGTCGSFSASTSIYAGTLADFGAAHSNYASGRSHLEPVRRPGDAELPLPPDRAGRPGGGRQVGDVRLHLADGGGMSAADRPSGTATRAALRPAAGRDGRGRGVHRAAGPAHARRRPSPRRPGTPATR